MATSATPDASEVKRRGRQRLIGAIAIAVLLVVFVPMILDKEPKPAKSGPSLEIPPQDKAQPLPPPSKSAPAAPASVVTPVEKAVTPVETGAQPKAQAPVPAVAPVEKPVAPVATAPQPKLEGFAVQVGAFKDEAKLTQAREKLAAAKVSHYVERVDTPNGELKRLRAGPFKTREAAEKALASIKAASLDGKVVPLP